MGGSADGAQWAVLVQVGAGIPSLFKLSGLMDMDRMSLLKALKHDEAFQVELEGVPLSKCVVTVCASVSDEGPTTDEVRSTKELKGAKTLGALASGMATAAADTYLFVRVTLPGGGTPTTAGEAAHGESRALIPAPGGPCWGFNEQC